MTITQVTQLVPEIAPLLVDADHVDVKSGVGALDLRPFIAGMFAYSPWWLTFLYGVRWFLVRLLGMRQQGVPGGFSMTADRLSFVPGEKAFIFEVVCAEEDRFWVARAAESHLIAHIAVVCEPMGANNRFHVMTIVHYQRWTGPVYFNIIRPFHHLVVAQMMKAGLRAADAPAVRL